MSSKKLPVGERVFPDKRIEENTIFFYVETVSGSFEEMDIYRSEKIKLRSPNGNKRVTAQVNIERGDDDVYTVRRSTAPHVNGFCGSESGVDEKDVYRMVSGFSRMVKKAAKDD